MRKFMLVLFLSTMITQIWAQTKQIKGKVTDENGLPLVGASIVIQNTKIGAQTDAAGKFLIKTSSTGKIILLISYTGYKSAIVSIVNSDDLNVKLEKQEVAMDDVVVIGYSSIKRKDLTGSVSSVSNKQFKDVPVSSAAEALQGRLAGVQIQATEGAPGADLVVRVRGGGSITQDNAPLYIVDGVQVENALSVLAPQDIATIDVLKDASTTSIYGARAANGVVIITTKSGKGGKTQVAYNGQFGFRELPKFLDVLSPYDFVMWQYERSRANIADSSSFAQTYGTTWDTLNVYKNFSPLNWQNEVFGRNAAFQNHNVSLSGGTQATSFNLSFTRNVEDGIQIESGFTRNLLNFKLDHKASDKFRVGVSFRYLDQTISGSGTTNSGTRTTNRLRHSINYRPLELPTPNGGIDDFDEAYFLASSGAINPVVLTRAEYRQQYTKAFYLTSYVSYQLAKNLTFRSTLGYDNSNSTTDLFFNKITAQARNFASLPLASIGEQVNSTINNSNTLQYQLNNYKKHHDLTLLIGQETVEQNSRQNSVETRFFPADISPQKALANMGLGSAPSGSQQPLPSTFIQPPSRIASFFARASYGYKDKYLANLNIRADRSSKFSSDNGTLYFPSGSFAWRISKEKFMENITWINDAKLRAGFGAVGNNRIDNLLYMQLYGVTGQYAINRNIVPGFAPISLSNPNLRWESNVTRNLGLDLSLFNNKIQVSVDVYKNTANNLLLAAAIPPTTGYTSQIQNIGATSNSGVELQINATPISNKKFSWTSNFNISFNRNKVENLGGVDFFDRTSGWQGSDGVPDYRVQVGRPVGLMYGFISDGWYGVDDFNYNATTRTYTIKSGVPVNGVYGIPQPGMMRWKDLNGDGVITADGDRAVIGDANPKFIGGWNNQFNYKNFDMSVFVNFVYGNDIYNANKIEWTDASFSNLNMLNIMKNRWTNIDASGTVVTDPTQLKELNANAQIWSPVRANRSWLHSWAIEDGSYLRINNITIGYTIPENVLKAAKISSVRIFATVNNLATLTKYTGYDPDVTTRRTDPLTPGVDFAAYPRSRTWIFGLNVNF
jgi:TonB-linked SusC/RagA family outer membrane protein